MFEQRQRNLSTVVRRECHGPGAIRISSRLAGPRNFAQVVIWATVPLLLCGCNKSDGSKASKPAVAPKQEATRSEPAPDREQAPTSDREPTTPSDEETTAAADRNPVPITLEPAPSPAPPAIRSKPAAPTTDAALDRPHVPDPPPSTPAVDSTTPSPHAAMAKIFANHYKISPKHGCHVELDTGGILTCGTEGKSSHITWVFLYRAPDGDVYEIARTFPATEETFRLVHDEHARQATLTKQVLYQGTTMVVSQDEFQRVVIYPNDVVHPPMVDDRTPRTP